MVSPSCGNLGSDVRRMRPFRMLGVSDEGWGAGIMCVKWSDVLGLATGAILADLVRVFPAASVVLWVVCLWQLGHVL
jgi:hypothetical protein